MPPCLSERASTWGATTGAVRIQYMVTYDLQSWTEQDEGTRANKTVFWAMLRETWQHRSAVFVLAAGLCCSVQTLSAAAIRLVVFQVESLSHTVPHKAFLDSTSGCFLLGFSRFVAKEPTKN